MNTRTKLYLVFACLLLVTAILFLIVRNWRLDHAAAQGSEGGPPLFRQGATDPERFREELTANSISGLLVNEGIVFDQRIVQEENTSDSHTFHVRIDSEPVSTREGKVSEQKTAVRSLRLLAARKNRQAPVGRKRSFELAPTQLVLFAVDDLKRVVWWDILPDPRILRAETADDGGHLTSRILYRERADLLFSLPERPDISAVYLYSADWEGKQYELHLIGNIDVRSSGIGK